MTPERWRQIDDLFDASLRLAPAERDAWLRQTCGGDDDLRTEVDRLLAQDERADRAAFLRPPSDSPASRSDGELARPRRHRPPREPGPIDRRQDGIRRRLRWLHPQAGHRRGHGAVPDLRAPIGGAGATARAADHLHPHPGDGDRLEKHRRRDGRRPRRSITSTRSSSWPSGASSPCSRAGGPSRSPGSRPWSWA